MRKENALRHLLLRHLWLRRKEVPQHYSEVTRSLRITRDTAGFEVSWEKAGVKHSARFGPEEFVFYGRGDIEGGPQLDDSANERLAAQFATSVFGPTAAGRSSASKVWMEPQPWWVAIHSLIVAGVFLKSGSPAAAFAATIAVPLEFLGALGKILTPIAFALMAWAGLPFVAFLSAIGYSALQFLDPNPNWRSTRTLAGLTVALGTVAGAGTGPLGHSVGLTGITVIVAAMAIWPLRWSLGNHFRTIPLLMPLWAVGLVLDGYSHAAFGMMLLVMADLVFARFGHRIAPVCEDRMRMPETMSQSRRSNV